MATAHVRHDGFARQSLHRETSDRLCSWCGGSWFYTLGDSPRTYRHTFTYTTESDARSCPRPVNRAFCNLACFDAYNG